MSLGIGRGISCFPIMLFLLLPQALLAVPASTHKIAKGETLWQLAQKYHTTPEAIAAANKFDVDAILTIGRAITIPSAQVSRPKHSFAVQTIVCTRADRVSLRQGPGTDHGRITVLPLGSTAKVLKTGDSWTKVAFGDGTCGYIYNDLLNPGPGRITYSAASPVPRVSATASSDVISTALSCRGIRYTRGGTSRSGFDCSGFTRYVYAKYGVALPHHSASQAKVGRPVSRKTLQPGDLVFFHTVRPGISHVGIYIGDNKFVHASSRGKGVTVSSLGSSYYSARYRGARRVK